MDSFNSNNSGFHLLNSNNDDFANKEEIGTDYFEEEMNYLLNKYEIQLRKVKSLTSRKIEIKLINIDDIDKSIESNNINNINNSLNSSKKSESFKINNSKDTINKNNYDVDDISHIHNSSSSMSNHNIDNRNSQYNMNFNPNDPMSNSHNVKKSQRNV